MGSFWFHEYRMIDDSDLWDGGTLLDSSPHRMLKSSFIFVKNTWAKTQFQNIPMHMENMNTLPREER